MDIFNTIINGEFTVVSYICCLGAALLCGVIIAVAASFKVRATKSFIVSLVLLPMIVQTVITMVNGNIGTGVAVMGAFSLVRFRSVPGKARDIAVIFLAMTAGLACATGYIAIAILFSLVISVAMAALSSISFSTDKTLDLRITVPESLNFMNEFDDLFNKYTKKHRLYKTKTTNMGSLYKLQYTIQMKNVADMQKFIDELRCRNGNLEISLAEVMGGMDEL